MEKEKFWNVDLIELFRYWFSDLSTFFMTALLFIGLSLPVVIPSLVLWFLLSINFSVKP